MKYRKKPVVIDAEEYRPGLEDGFGYLPRGSAGVAIVCDGTGALAMPDPERHGEIVPIIMTLEGAHRIMPGDFIITGVKGERYPCKPDIFAATYDPA